MYSIKINWLTLDQKLKFHLPDESGEQSNFVTASWSDIIDLYEKEKLSSIRRTRLSPSALNPSSFERQKVSLTLQVFDDKTVAALVQDRKHDTAAFIYHILRMWKQLNNRSLTAHIHLNDEARAPITHTSQLKFLGQMSRSIKESAPKTNRARHQTMTTQTSSALVQTLDGVIDMSTNLLKENGTKYILLGHFQSDCLEGEFGY